MAGLVGQQHHGQLTHMHVERVEAQVEEASERLPEVLRQGDGGVGTGEECVCGEEKLLAIEVRECSGVCVCVCL